MRRLSGAADAKDRIVEVRATSPVWLYPLGKGEPTRSPPAVTWQEYSAVVSHGMIKELAVFVLSEQWKAEI